MVTFDDVDSEVIVEGPGGPAPAPLDPEELRRVVREILREELERLERVDVERAR